MRKFLLIVATVGLWSCTQTVKEKSTTSNANDTAKVSLADNQPQIADSREKIIAELNKLSNAIAKKDKSVILSFFEFPIADSAVNFFEVDTVFDAKRQSNAEITKEMFSNSFNNIYELTEMAELNALFKYLNTADLIKKSHIDYTKETEDDGCSYLYGITIKGMEVYLNYGTNSNDSYRKKHPDEEEVCSEYGVNWGFKFDGEKLKFFQHRIAG